MFTGQKQGVVPPGRCVSPPVYLPPRRCFSLRVRRESNLSPAQPRQVLSRHAALRGDGRYPGHHITVFLQHRIYTKGKCDIQTLAAPKSAAVVGIVEDDGFV